MTAPTSKAEALDLVASIVVRALERGAAVGDQPTAADPSPTAKRSRGTHNVPR